MINLARLQVPKFFISDSISTINKQKETRLVQKLKTNFTPTYLSVKDTTLGSHSCGPMFKIVVESPAFKQKTKLQQHQMVMDAISEDIDSIHAFNLKTRIPTELNVLSLGLGIMPSSESEKSKL